MYRSLKLPVEPTRMERLKNESDATQKLHILWAKGKQQHTDDGLFFNDGFSCISGMGCIGEFEEIHNYYNQIFGFENCWFFLFMLGSHHLEANSLAYFFETLIWVGA